MGMSIQVVVVGGLGIRLGHPVCDAILASGGELKLAAVVESPAVVKAFGGPSGFGGALFTGSLSEVQTALKEDRRNRLVADLLDKVVVFYATKADALLPRLLGADQCGFGTHVIGTTGLSEEDLQMIEELSERNRIVRSPNFSLGAWLGAEQCAGLALALPQAEVEIIEIHHDQKEDAPSGTALLWAKAVVAARGQVFDDVVVYGRHGKSKRTPEQVCIHSLRGGKVPGLHRALFFGPYDDLVVEHNVRSGDVFAQGALTAIRWAAQKDTPGIYGMPDALNLKFLKELGVS